MNIRTPSGTVAAFRLLPAGTLLAAIASTLFLSAFLLFGVQPLFAKMVLPKLGGSAAVWSVALVFFQAVLLLGYAYAHLIASRLSVRMGALVHLCVLALAFVMLPLAYPSGFDAPPEEGQALWTLAVFAAGVGLPFFAVSANAPLLQSWFSQSGQRHASDPYFLYGASNIGSFGGLMLYPFLVEPLMSLGTQSLAWTVAYGALAVMIAVCGLLTWDAARQAGANTAAQDADAEDASRADPTWRDRLSWMFLAFVPSGLLVAVSAHISTDLVAAPFLWVLPLALYLLAFVVAFNRDPWIGREQSLVLFSRRLAPFLIFILAFNNAFVTVPLHLAALFIMAMVCNSEVFARRPNAVHLTEFYLFLSAGGVLGGLFAALLSPHIFDRVYEYPLLIVAVFFCRADAWKALASPDGRRDLAWFLLCPLALVPALLDIDLHDGIGRFAVAAACVAVAVLVLRNAARPVAQAGLVAAGFVMVLAYGYNQQAIDRARSFYGVHTVLGTENGTRHVLMHGTTLHGVQDWNADGSTPQGRPTPNSYYYPQGPFGAVISQVRAAHGGRLGRVAVIGLGSGSLACLRQDGEDWRYFEIDAEVERIARDPKLFTFLAKCDPASRVVIGDGRLTLAGEPGGSFDLVIIDAFSSDAIPVHLLTREAMELYWSRLSPSGVIVFHISNNYLDLPPVVAAQAEATGAAGFVTRMSPELWSVDRKKGNTQPSVATVARDPRVLAPFAADPRWRPLSDEPPSLLWTDDYSNILAAMWRKVWQKPE